MAEETGIAFDQEDERNIPLFNLVSLAPAALCQWVSEGVSLDDAGEAIEVAALVNGADESFAVSLPGFSSSIAKGLVCPEYEAALTLQYAGATEPVFTDPFDSAESGWPVESYDHGQLRYSSGFYRMLPDGSESLLESVFPDEYTNVIINASIRPIRGSDSEMGYGLMCRNDPTSGDSYLFQVTPDGHYAVIRYDADRFAILDEGQSELIHGGDSWNHLTAICHGTRLAFLVNGSLVTQADDDGHTEGGTGLAAWSAGTTGADVVIADYYLAVPDNEDLAMLNMLRETG